MCHCLELNPLAIRAKQPQPQAVAHPEMLPIARMMALSDQDNPTARAEKRPRVLSGPRIGIKRDDEFIRDS